MLCIKFPEGDGMKAKQECMVSERCMVSEVTWNNIQMGESEEEFEDHHLFLYLYTYYHMHVRCFCESHMLYIYIYSIYYIYICIYPVSIILQLWLVSSPQPLLLTSLYRAFFTDQTEAENSTAALVPYIWVVCRQREKDKWYNGIHWRYCGCKKSCIILDGWNLKPSK